MAEEAKAKDEYDVFGKSFSKGVVHEFWAAFAIGLFAGLFLRWMIGFPIKAVIVMAILTPFMDLAILFVQKPTPTKDMITRLFWLAGGMFGYLCIRIFLGQLLGMELSKTYMNAQEGLNELLWSGESAISFLCLLLTVSLFKYQKNKTGLGIVIVLAVCVVMKTINPDFATSISMRGNAWLSLLTSNNVQEARRDNVDADVNVYQAKKDIFTLKRGQKVSVLKRSQFMETSEKSFQVLGGATIEKKKFIASKGFVLVGSEPYVPVVIEDSNGLFVGNVVFAPLRMLERVIEVANTATQSATKTGASQILFTNTYTDANLGADGKVVILDFTKTKIIPGDVLNIYTTVSNRSGNVKAYFNDGKQFTIPNNGSHRREYESGDPINSGGESISFTKECGITVRVEVVRNS